MYKNTNNGINLLPAVAGRSQAGAVYGGVMCLSGASHETARA